MPIEYEGYLYKHGQIAYIEGAGPKPVVIVHPNYAGLKQFDIDQCCFLGGRPSALPPDATAHATALAAHAAAARLIAGPWLGCLCCSLAAGLAGLYPIVTSHYNSTGLYQVSYHNQ